MSDNIDWAAHTQPISFDRKASDEFSEESLIIRRWSVIEAHDGSQCGVEKLGECGVQRPDVFGLVGNGALIIAVMSEDIERARNAFRAYAHKDDGPFDKENPFPFETHGTPERDELEWALGWLKDNFTALWT